VLTAQLRKSLLALVCLNLVFVQITGAVSLAWMVPLFALTLASPYLWNLQRLLVYRLGWNAALVAIFGLLIVDIRRSGIRFMLEDGLILAAFCQVHVLNNLIKQQRPDLIFFNSFLIALVTGFFCQDVMYSGVFVVYALILITSMAIASAGTAAELPTRILPAVELRAVVRRSTRHGFVALFVTAIVFTFWPRDFQREGLVDDELVDSRAAAEIAFSDQIRLDRKNSAVLTNRIVMNVKLSQGTKESVPEYWRGATFATLNRNGWTADTKPQSPNNRSRQLDERWQSRGRGQFVRPGHRTAAVLEVKLHDSKARNLFLPSTANRIRFGCGAWPSLDGNFRLSRSYASEIVYTMDLRARDETSKPAPGKPSWIYRQLQRRTIPDGSEALEEQVRRLYPASASERAKVEVIREFLSTQREYLLPGETGAAPRLQDFIAGDGGGHCEYFATTMVVLLRLNQIPCRMVGGYLAHEWNEDETQLVIRSNHAHAWVEVWDDKTGWFLVDPTPAQSEMTAGDDSLFATIGQFLHRAWNTVTSFDGGSRTAAFAWAKDQWIALVAAARAHPVWFTFAVLGLLVLRRWRRLRNEPKLDPDVRDYLGVLAKLRLDIRPGETPRQLLARAQATDLPTEGLAQLTAATERHELARYT
jgi:TgpA N-terminal domain/Transglutaminase-like superfamily